MSDATKRWARRRVTIKPEHDLAVSLEAIYAMGDALGAEVERLEAENKHYREVGIPAAHKAGLIIARGAERDAYARKVAEAVREAAVLTTRRVWVDDSPNQTERNARSHGCVASGHAIRALNLDTIIGEVKP